MDEMEMEEGEHEMKEGLMGLNITKVTLNKVTWTGKLIC